MHFFILLELLPIESSYTDGSILDSGKWKNSALWNVSEADKEVSRISGTSASWRLLFDAEPIWNLLDQW